LDVCLDEQWKEIPMTIIGAALCGDCVVIASDSLAFNPSLEAKDERSDKLWQLGQLNVIWGFFGPDDIGSMLKMSLRDMDFSAVRNWAELARILGNHSAELHSEIRRRVKLTGAKLKANEVVHLMLAGYVGGRDGILLVNADGRTTVPGETPAFLASPVGTAHARATLETLRLERGRAFGLNANTLGTIMEIAARLTLGTGGTIQMWRTTSAEVERLQ
jgi:hypothetical protein